MVIDTFNKSFSSRNRLKNLIFYSDSGFRYTSQNFRKLLEQCNVIQTFSAKGYPDDNAVAESFFKFLKLEELNRQTFYTKAQFELSLFEYMEGFYNSKRPHSTNHMLSPNQKESCILKIYKIKPWGFLPQSMASIWTLDTCRYCFFLSTLLTIIQKYYRLNMNTMRKHINRLY